jgi:hypothetical protein
VSVGAPELAARAVSVLALVLLAVAGCTGDAPPPPTRLSDGSPARPPPVTLSGVDGPRIATRARVVPPGEAKRHAATAACIGSRGAVADVAVERIDADGLTVTFRDPEGESLYGCDSDDRSGGGTNGERWCAHAFGLLAAGRLRDPRLSLGCRDTDGRPVGFAWVQPSADTAYVVVSRDGYSAVYPVAGGLPVRVGTENVDIESSSATFDVAEHARDGRRLRVYELEAAVSG